MSDELIVDCRCGGKPVVARRRYEDGDTLIWVQCPKCGSEGDNWDKQSKAIELWNRKQAA